MITGRVYTKDEAEQLSKLANSYGVQKIERNIDTFSDIGMDGWWHPEKGIHKGLHLMNPIRGKLIA
ncbi:MAG: hypothetical protein HYV77_01925, partial [Candidatus Wildermuthbacteria bacterium]|nr:hypothetical protein [Candidatus Wildermuthbacteria bacterium]